LSSCLFRFNEVINLVFVRWHVIVDERCMNPLFLVVHKCTAAIHARVHPHRVVILAHHMHVMEITFLVRLAYILQLSYVHAGRKKCLT
jgi:hypothetical protein